MSTRVKVAVVQCELGGSREENLDRVMGHLESAAAEGAHVVLLPELFEGPYFPQVEDESWFAFARPFEGNPTIERIRAFSVGTRQVIPVSFFERSGQSYYNSVAMVCAGEVLGLYRKSHIPDGPGYEEKFYFRPGDTGFRVWPTPYGTIGVAICWDQWFPEAARAMALQGADLLLYPTCIGVEPLEPELDSKDPWQRAMIGHAVSNAVMLAAANRVGTEGAMTFFGSSFISDMRGEKVAELGRTETGIATATYELEALQRYRANWGFFRDRRPELYPVLLTADGRRAVPGGRSD